MKPPVLRLNPADWQRDAALRSCSVPARGLWVEMLCIMHQAETFGHLQVNGNPIGAAQLARMVGALPDEVSDWMKELEDARVFQRDPGGAILSHQMIKEESTRKARAEGGKLGGNPTLKGTAGSTPNKDKDEGRITLEDNLPDKIIDGKDNLRMSSRIEKNPVTSSSVTKIEILDPEYLSADSPDFAEGLPDLFNPGGGPLTSPDGTGHRNKNPLPECPVVEIIKLYHEVLPEHPSVERLTDKRRVDIRQRWREMAVEKKWTTQEEGLIAFRKFFEYVRSSKFLTGRVPPQRDRTTFIATIDFLMRASAHVKILEGHFHQ